MEPFVEFSVVIPCLNEGRSIGTVVAGARAVLAGLGVAHEVVVADNGSTDDSREKARAAGARVVDASAQKGAGAATCFGVAESRGRFVILMDADGEHDPSDLPALVRGARENERALVLGSRYKGRFLKGASSLPNRMLGTPVLTFLINHYFGTRITDCNTGFRALSKETFERIGVRTPGFEFCSEMIARAALIGVEVVEVPITQHPGPPGRVTHLRRMRDGWRHLKFILLHAPDRVLLRPGIASLVIGALLFFPQVGGRFELGPIAMDIHLMILGALCLFIGVEMVGSAILCATIAGEPVAPAGRLSRRLGEGFNLDRMLPVGGALLFLGFLGDLGVLLISAMQGWRGVAEPRLALLGTTLMGVGTQVLVLSFVHSVIDQHRSAPEPSPAAAGLDREPRKGLAASAL